MGSVLSLKKTKRKSIPETMDTKEYEAVLSELHSLALSLPDNPDKESLQHFMDLEERAEEHEKEIDIRKGFTTVTVELDEMVLFKLARKARRSGKTTNKYIVERLIEILKADPAEDKDANE